MDLVESSKSQWTGRYSWGDENQSSTGLSITGSKILTNYEQYLGSNTRTLSPRLVNEARFGYTRFFNSTGTYSAFNVDTVAALGIPGLQSRRPGNLGRARDFAERRWVQRHRRQHRRPVCQQQQHAAIRGQPVVGQRQAHLPLRVRIQPPELQPDRQPVFARQFRLSAERDAQQFATPAAMRSPSFCSVISINPPSRWPSPMPITSATPKPPSSTTPGRSHPSSRCRWACATN